MSFPVPGLAPEQVEIWWLLVPNLLDERIEARWLALLDEEERLRAAQYRNKRDRQNYIAAHALTRRMLAVFSGQKAEKLEFVRPSLRKPALLLNAGAPPLFFNMSHTPGLVACAITVDREVGVDVEFKERNLTALEIANAYFAPQECEMLKAAAPDKQHDVFLRIWTLKEAFIKATGEGLSRSLDSFTVNPESLCVNFIPPSRVPTNWQLFQKYPSRHHILAVAAKGQDADFNCRTVKAVEI